MDVPRFGDCLATILAEKGMSQKDFAKKAGVTPVFVHKLVRGTKAPPRGRLEPWADLLELERGQRQGFIEAGMWARMPTDVREWLACHLPSRKTAATKRKRTVTSAL